MDRLAELIRNKMSVDAFVANDFPALTAWGVEDQDVMIHSLGVSSWNSLGHELGFMAVAECPVPFSGIAADDIRSDSVWFDKEKKQPVVIVEFERYDGTEHGRQKLIEKAENLLEANNRWGGAPQVLVLAAWSSGMVTAPDHHLFTRKIREGFKNRKGAMIKGNPEAKFLFSRFYFQKKQGQRLLLDRLVFED